MKKSIFSGLFLVWAVAQAAAVPETYGIDPMHSFVLFKVRFLWASNIYGCFCGGVSGKVSFDPAAPEKSTVELEIKTDTLDTGFAQWNNDIKSPNFLNVQRFPLITFKSNSVQKVNDRQYTVTGELTFHGVTKPLTIQANLTGRKGPNGESRTGADMHLTIKLSEFGVNYRSPA
ncbi:MAG TPA: YceI family protein, partial [Chthoniobacterales bacterium]|nr:YceI family protein [Chthoniobacterales bacterium]